MADNNRDIGLFDFTMEIISAAFVILHSQIAVRKVEKAA